MEEIVINIPSNMSKSEAISIQANLINFSYNGRNHAFEFEISSVEPDNALIPRTSENISESIIVILSSTESHFSNWRIRQFGENFILKTYPNPSEMTLDTNFNKA